MATATQRPGDVAADLRTALHLGAGYAPRSLRFIRRERLGDWRLKVYGIATESHMPRPELVEATVDLARAVLPEPATGGERSGIGFVIAHDAATVCFGLVYWWQAANELHQRVYTSPRDDPRTLIPIAAPAAGCVWELGIIDFERRAWVDDVLANPAGPDIERYMARELDVVV
jgi:hypothetical protein